MSCNLWKEMAFAFVEGALPAAAASGYAAHLEGCESCRAETAASEALLGSLRGLPAPPIGSAQARDFDATVLARLGVAPQAAAERQPEQRLATVLAAAARRAGAPAAAVFDVRAAAARTIATRSRQATRPSAPPAPSFMLASLVLSTVSLAITFLFGEWMVRAIGSSFTLALGTLGASGGWLAERVGAKVLEMVAVLRVARVLGGDPGAVFEGLHQLASARGPEVVQVSVLALALLWLTGFVVRRDRGRARDAGGG